MNRRNFIKTIGLASLSTLVPYNVFSDNSESVEELTLENATSNSNFNGTFIESELSKNGLIKTNCKYFGKNTKEIVEKCYNAKLQHVWFLQNDKFPKEDVFYTMYNYALFGYNGTAENIVIPLCLDDNKSRMFFIIDMCCGLSNTVKQIKFKDYSTDKIYGNYPIIYNYFSEQLFGFTFEELNKKNLNNIILPKKMFEENKKYIPIIEKNTKIKFECQN